MRTKLRSKISLLFVALAMMLAMPAVALADIISNDIDAIDAAVENTSVAVDGTKSVGYLVDPTNGDGKNGCNLTGDKTLGVSVASSDTSVATVSPSSLTFDSCGATPSVTVTGVSAGTATISLTQTSNNTGATFDLAPATFSVTVQAATSPPPPADTTAPVITKVVTPASPDGQNGWYKSNVSVDWTVVDNESAISSQSGCDDFSVTSDQQATTYTCTATSAGGTSSDSVSIKRDATKPTNVQFSGGGLSDGASYDFGNVPAAPTECTADDATSGLSTCVVSGGGTTVGNHTLTAKATDKAGNEETTTLSYTVNPWNLKGFHAPVDMGMMNYAKGGSTVPLKFEVFQGQTELTSTSVVSTFTQKVNCDSSLAGDNIEQYATGNTELRYDSTSGQFIFNWKTPKAPGSCYLVTMKTQDGSAISANFQLK